MVKKIRSKGTSNVLQGGGVSGVRSKTTFLHFFLGTLPLPGMDDNSHIPWTEAWFPEQLILQLVVGS